MAHDLAPLLIKPQATTQNEQSITEMIGLEEAYGLFNQPEETCAA